MQLWTKSGSYPSALPPSDTDQEGRIWTDLANNPDGQAATGWTSAPPAPAFDAASEILTWTDGAWRVEDRPADPPPPAPPVVRVTKSDFSRLLTFAELARMNAKRRQVAELTAADYEDPDKAPLIELEIVIQQFDLPAEFIELTHPDTVVGVQLLAREGILDPSRPLERIAEILANVAPVAVP